MFNITLVAEDHEPSIGIVCEPLMEEEPNWQSPQTNLDTSPESEPALEIHSRAAPSVEAHHRSVGPNTGRNSGGKQKKQLFDSVNII